VSTVDPIKVYFTVSEQEYLSYVSRNPSEREREAAHKQLELELVLADGTTYPQKGKFYVADRNVDQKTGAIRLAGLFPNPGNVLRPGQYGRVRAVTALQQGALLIPQRAVAEMQGIYQVAVVGGDNRVDIRSVKVGERVESKWIITDGLRAGDTVVAEGIQKVGPAAQVRTRPFMALAPASGD
jgi:membrane fusion protein (multidrug efflux system)